MRTSISINEFIFICNHYLADDTVTSSFSAYGVNNDLFNIASSLKLNKSVISDETVSYSDSSFRADSHYSSSTLDYSLLADRKQRDINKYTSIVEFLIQNASTIVDTATCSKESFFTDLTQQLAANSIALDLKEESYEKLQNEFKMYDKNMEVPKTHPIRSFLAKKIGLPALATVGVGGIIGGILSGLPVVANSSFVSPNPVANFFSWFTAGALVSIPVGLGVFTGIHKLTVQKYAKKYGSKAGNLEAMDALDIQDMKTLQSESTILPIKNLMAELKSTNDKIIENNSGNWFQRHIVNFHYKKKHRNLLWAAAAYIQDLRCKGETSDEKQYNNCKLLLSYIDDCLSKEVRTNFVNYSSANKKLENVDIYATIFAGRDKKDSVEAVKDSCHSLVRTLSLEHYNSEAQSPLFNLSSRCSLIPAPVEEPVEEEVEATVDVVDEANAEQDETIEQEVVTTETYTESAEAVEKDTTSTSEESVKNLVKKAASRNPELRVKELKSQYNVIVTRADGTKDKVVVKKTNDTDIDELAVSATVRSCLSSAMSTPSEADDETKTEDDSNIEQLSFLD